jgi:CPA1 family monovalent cation:H+ antiporter
VGLVGFTVFGVAILAGKLIPGMDWRAGFLLGAVVSPTDAIAATSIAKTLGLPRGITDVLEGESLVNDATGLLALEFGVGMLVQGQIPTVGDGALGLLYLIAAGLGVGLLIGVVTSWFERFVDDAAVEIVISLVVPYASYLAGEAVKASGVLAVVACGLYMSRRSAVLFSPETRIQVNAVWKALTFVLNGLVFVLIGLQLPHVLQDIHGMRMSRLAMYGLVFTALLIVLRLVWTFPGAEVSYQFRKRVLRQEVQRVPARGIFVVGWTGMRGVLSLAAAISLPGTLADGSRFEQKNMIVFLTFCVILVTLVLQGLTLPALIRKLGLAGAAEDKEEEIEARRSLLEAVIAHLELERKLDEPRFDHAYEDLLHQYEHRLLSVGGGSSQKGLLNAELEQRLQVIAKDAVDVERRTLLRMRDEGRIGDDVLRTLEYELDLTDSRTRSRAEAIEAARPWG